jgi:hypothetical protein
MWSTERPAPGEHHEYYGTHIGQVPDEDVLACLRTSLEETLKPLSGAPDSAGGYRYAPGKWSVREFDDEAARRTGVASGNRFTARACAWIIAGHEMHHRPHLAPPRS